MNLLRNEIRTGLLVVLSLSILVAVLLYLGAPGFFVPQRKLYIFFDNAAGIKPGAAVLLAGRKIGQVRKLSSPVPEKDRPDPKLETLIEVEVEASAKIYRIVRVQMTQNSLLGESIIDFTSGDENSGLATDNASFVGERPGGLADAVPTILNKIDPALAKVTTTLDSLQKTADNLTKITADGADLPMAFSELKKFGANLDDLTSVNGPVYHTLHNIDALTDDNGTLSKTIYNFSLLTSPNGDFSKTMQNAEKFTAHLATNKDIDAAFRNLRTASEELNRTLLTLGQKFGAVGSNLELASDTVKRQPWRLIWPATKKYPPATQEGSPSKPSPGRRNPKPRVGD